MRNNLLVIIYFLLVSFAVTAQEEESTSVLSAGETMELISGHVIFLEIPVENDILQLNQLGNENQLTAIQQLDDVSDYILNATQQGNRNIGYVNQEGNNHESVLFQNGDLNNASLWSVGAKTQNIVKQDGDGNMVNSYIENFNLLNRVASSVQIGDKNRIDLQLWDTNSSNPLMGVEVIQNGSNNLAGLSLEHYDAPYLKIEQTGNSAPPVTITHTDFSFPLK